MPMKETTGVPARLSEQVTVVMVPRERLSCTPRAVSSVVRSLPDDVPVIVVDGAFPDDIRRELDATSHRRPLRILRFDHYLLPQEARNLALALVETPYTAFVDNDIDVRTGWLEALIEAVRAHDAAIGAPVIGLRTDRGAGVKDYVHHAGGDIRLMQYKGRTTYASHRRLEWSLVDDPAVAKLPRTSDDFECHAFLIETATVRQLGGFDERLVICDHDDLALRLHVQGKKIVFSANAHVCYDQTGSLDAADRDYFAFRWNRRLVDHACEAFEQNWKISQSRSWEWARGHRKRMLSANAPTAIRWLPEPLFELYAAYLRTRGERREPVRRRARAVPVVCPDIPQSVSEFVRDKLSARQPGTEFPIVPWSLRDGAALRAIVPTAS
jgi:GT2 family glycosyltransferase